MKCFGLRVDRPRVKGAVRLPFALLIASLGVTLAPARALGANVSPGDKHSFRATANGEACDRVRLPACPTFRLSARGLLGPPAHRSVRPPQLADGADDVTSAEAWSYVVIRWWTFGAIVTLLGVVCFGNVVVPVVRRDVRPAISADLDRGVRLVGIIASVAVVLGAAARVMAQRAMLFEALGSEFAITLGDVLSGTFGLGVAAQLAGGLVGIIAFVRHPGTRASRNLSWGAIVCAVAPALSGHAAGGESLALPVVADTVHVLAAGAWAGTLLLLAAVGIPAALRHSGDDPKAAVLGMLRVFSPVALGSAALLAVTGVYASWVHLASFDALWATRYGQALLLKVGLVALMIVAGAINWRRLGPGAGTSAGAGRLSRSAWRELAIAATILLVTAVLVARPLPSEMAP